MRPRSSSGAAVQALLALVLFAAACTRGGPHPEPPSPVFGAEDGGGPSGEHDAGRANTPDSQPPGQGAADAGSGAGSSAGAGGSPDPDEQGMSECLDAGALQDGGDPSDSGPDAAVDCDDDAGALR